MSREVRRVPLDWQHPTEPNPYWRSQQDWRRQQGRPESRLHAPDMRFVALFADLPGAEANHAEELSQISRREGFHWTWSVGYYLTGYTGIGDGEFHDAQPWDDSVTVEDENHLQRLLIQQHTDERPDPANYMPVFDVPAEDLGWCLYETVSEGSPVTPGFASAGELIEHLTVAGEDWDQVPYRREAAERLVQSGSSFGSFAVVDGVFFNNAKDADLLNQRLGGTA